MEETCNIDYEALEIGRDALYDRACYVYQKWFNSPPSSGGIMLRPVNYSPNIKYEDIFSVKGLFPEIPLYRENK